MNELFKKLCPIAAVLCLVLCLGGAVGVFINASGAPQWQATGVFFVGVSIFVFFTLIALPMLTAEADTKTTKYNDKTAEKPQKGKNKQTNKQNSSKKNAGDDKPQKPQKPQSAENKESNKDSDETSKAENNGDDGIKRDTGEQINGDSGPVTLYIANLTEDVSELDIREEFGVFGAVKSVKIVADKETGVSKGYAFVEMANKAEANLAMEDINGQEIKGKQVKVSYARRKKRGKRSNNNKK